MRGRLQKVPSMKPLRILRSFLGGFCYIEAIDANDQQQDSGVKSSSQRGPRSLAEDAMIRRGFGH